MRCPPAYTCTCVFGATRVVQKTHIQHVSDYAASDLDAHRAADADVFLAWEEMSAAPEDRVTLSQTQERYADELEHPDGMFLRYADELEHPDAEVDRKPFGVQGDSARTRGMPFLRDETVEEWLMHYGEVGRGSSLHNPSVATRGGVEDGREKDSEEEKGGLELGPAESILSSSSSSSVVSLKLRDLACRGCDREKPRGDDAKETHVSEEERPVRIGLEYRGGERGQGGEHGGSGGGEGVSVAQQRREESKDTVESSICDAITVGERSPRTSSVRHETGRIRSDFSQTGNAVVNLSKSSSPSSKKLHDMSPLPPKALQRERGGGGGGGRK